MATDDLKIQLRLPRDLHAQLVASAEQHHRSLNGEIVAAIEFGRRAEAEVDAQVAALMPVLGPRVAEAIRAQNAAERARRKAR